MALNKIKKHMLGEEVSKLLNSVNLTSPDGSEWIITIDNSGNVKAVKKTV